MKKIRNSVLATVVMLGVAAAARGQEAAPPAPVPVGRVSVASLQAVNDLMKELGVPPVPLTEMIEQRVPMPLEKGSIAEDQPLGVVLMAGDKLPSDMSGAMSSVVVALPVVTGKLSAADLKKNGGAEDVKNQPGVMATTTMGLRRTEKYLLGQFGKPAGIGAVAADPFAADYKDKSNLAVMMLDVAALRKVMGPTLQQMAAQAQPMATPGTATSPDVVSQGMIGMAAGPALNFLNTVDKLTVAVSQDPQNMHLRTWVTPFALAGGAAPAAMPQPKFPNGTVLVMHVVYPGGPGSQWTDSLANAAPLPDESAKTHEKEFREFTKRALRLFAGGDAVSVGVAPRGNTATFYVVSQLHDAVDYGNELQALKTLGQAGMDPGETVEITNYDAGGKKVVRLTDKNATGKVTMVLDGIQDGKTVFATFSEDEGHYVGDLASAGMGPASNLMVSGALDLGGMVQHLEDAGPLAPMPDPAKKALADGFAGQTVTWSAQAVPESKSLLMQVHVPKAALKMVAAMRMTQSPPPGPEGAPGPMPGQPAQ